ncbi:MAG: DUF883 family protein [Pseudomonadota bacterium]
MATADDKYEELSKQIETLRGDMAKLTEAVGDVARSELESGRDRARGYAEETLERGRAAGRRVRAGADEGLHEAAEYVRERPLGTVLAAAAVGMLFGFLTAKR